MTTLRFDFQRSCVQRTTGLVFNVGASTDPASLRATFGARVWNCDLLAYDPLLHTQLVPQLRFDCRKPWPIADDDGEMVVLGDILEHLDEGGQRVSLREAHRVAPWLCLTVPCDERFVEDPGERLPDYPGLYHNSVVTASGLLDLLAVTGWDIVLWQTVDYGFVPEGYFILARRAEGS